MPGPLQGRVALVTGAGRPGGLGQAIASRLVQDRAAVMLHDRGSTSGSIAPAHGVGTSDELAGVALLIAEVGGIVDTITGDLMSETESRPSWPRPSRGSADWTSS